MASFNKVILAGNLTRDPQLSQTASNTTVCKFGLATNRKWRDRNTGENREEVCYVDCTAFGRSAEVINQYMGKGRSILIEGRLQFSQWQAQDGGRRSKLEVVVENFQFLGSPGGGQRDGGNYQAQSAGPPPRSAGAGTDPMDDPGPPPDEDVPF